MSLLFSFIIPVYNRPQEVRELLESFSVLEYAEPYEIVIVEDGSTETAAEVIEEFRSVLDISYYYKENSGPGDSRNYGMSKARGNYFIILDSDVILPPHYLETVSTFLENQYFECYGGADAAHKSFSAIQKAINHSMTSFLSTGGIRGKRNQIGKFEPRSFNMGISKEVFEKTAGFGKIHPGEDPDLSLRIRKAGYKTTFIPNAFVFHKRRISWSKFYKQVRKFGLVRPILSKWHPGSAKITFWFPTLFVVYLLLALIISIICLHIWAFIPLALYLIAFFTEALFKTRDPFIAVLSVFALFIQFLGYGIAFLHSTIQIHILNKDPEKQFPNLFFK
ncbi:glycosyltransferase [Aureitalea sp. L0-47]|uniref:glycosyltransferase n=1 Tax=Aureitalea sp. L0-47 TaxID=2816962 RepID=UPI002237E05D|nr:glycosyltransferase [Aureitalea sp. L0-47]MCW5519640.1 glycosyltransferase [Aureitalea sp. L0-47]